VIFAAGQAQKQTKSGLNIIIEGDAK